MNFPQTPEEIIKNASAEQRISWNYIFLRFGAKIGISQFYFHEGIAGSEFLIYSANKLYLALDLTFYGSSGMNAVVGYVTLYNEANAIRSISQNSMLSWDATAAAFKYISNNVYDKNLCFSRIVATVYGGIKFCGYRLSI